MKEKEKEKICSICLCDETEVDVELVHCSHEFHRHCISRWIATCAETKRPPTCPYCTQLIMPKDLKQLVINLLCMKFKYFDGALLIREVNSPHIHSLEAATVVVWISAP